MAFWKKELEARKSLKTQLQAQAKAEIVPSSTDGTKSLPIDWKDKLTTPIANFTEQKGISFLSMLANAENISKEVIQFINKDTTYIARIPKKLDNDMKNGLLDFMCDKKTGERLGVLVDEKHKSRGFMRIEEANRMEIAPNLANIAMHQQLAQMTEAINDVRARVISLQKKHDRDLFGEIKGAYDQLIQSRNVTAADTKKQLIIGAITKLNGERRKSEGDIIDILSEGLGDIPSTNGAILWKTIMDKNFLSNTVENYNRIEKLFEYYMTATQLLGYAFAFLDEPSAYEDVFMPSAEIIGNVNLQKLIAVENLFNESIGETWYKNPKEFLIKIKDTVQSVFSDNSDFVEIEVLGDKLIEVIEHGSRAIETNGEMDIS